MAWPPTLDELKDELAATPGTPGVAVGDTRDDSRLQRVLDAAVTFVERVRPDLNFTEDPMFRERDDVLVEVPEPGPDVELGTLRLAIRWHTRRRSPDALISMAELGSTRVPSFDPDIDRLLRIGRHAKPRVG